MATTPKIIAQIRAIDNGAWDMGMADFSSNDLESAYKWALHNDPYIMVVIEDELDFRSPENFAEFKASIDP